MTKQELKQKLIAIRKGGHITPLLEELWHIINKNVNCHTPEAIIEDMYDNLFHALNECGDNDLHDLVIEYSTTEGKTIRISWQDREKRMVEREEEN